MQVFVNYGGHWLDIRSDSGFHDVPRAKDFENGEVVVDRLRMLLRPGYRDGQSVCMTKDGNENVGGIDTDCAAQGNVKPAVTNNQQSARFSKGDESKKNMLRSLF